MKTDRDLVIISRHAHRDTTFRSDDNGLSEKGRKQAERLRDEVLKLVKKGAPLKLLSSPRLRCIETLEPLGRALRLGVEVDDRLCEQREGEGKSEFLKRVLQFKEAIERPNDWDGASLVFCSHGDWIPEFLLLTLGARRDLEKSAHLVLKKVDHTRL